MQPKDLITKDKIIYKGFKWQANKKKTLAVDLLKDSAEAKRRLKKVSSFQDILDDNLMLDFVVGASMLSKKSIQHFSHDELISYLSDNIKFERITEQNYLNELEKLYLLSCGDSVGGKIRNIVGQKGNQLFVDYITDYLNEYQVEFKLKRSGENIQIIETEKYAILFNKKPKFIGKSVDFIVLLKDEQGHYDIENPLSYISLGELKGGIDPAGADEHWKTATTAISRIHSSFNKIDLQTPNLFFIGGAISRHMATEIIELIQYKKIKNAANLNYPKQMHNIIKELFID